jgi:hypothetical protein
LQQDLDAVACNTHKESPALLRTNGKTAGMMCACLSTGLIVCVAELFGSESLSQRYLFLSKLRHLYPELKLVVHDDACHLHKFSEVRAGECHYASLLAPPLMRFVCDEFHMVGHTDAWCLAHCNPKAPDVRPSLEGIRTSVCEFTFTWLSQYKYQTKHMSQFGFLFFCKR